MSQIKTRIWDCKAKKIYDSGYSISQDGLYWYDDNAKEYSLTKEVYVITQHIGLTDKYGKELYQNDIVKYISENDGETEFISEVDATFIAGIFVKSAELSFEFALFDNHLSNGNFEIVGNIFENPELVENQTKIYEI